MPTEIIYARLLEQQQQQNAEQPKEMQPSKQPSAGGASGSGNGYDPTTSGQTGNHVNPDQGSTRRGNSTFPARHWGEVRDLTKQNGHRLSPTERLHAEHDLDVRIRQAAAAAKRVGKFGTAQREMVEIATDRVDWRDKFRMTLDRASFFPLLSSR